MANVSYDNDRITCVLDFGTDAQGNSVSKRYGLSNVSRDSTDDNILSYASVINTLTGGQGIVDVLRRKTSILTQ
jgi:hypothetical protein